MARTLPPVRPARARVVALGVVVAAVVLAVAACGVEVPDDVAAEIDATATTESTDAPTTTEAPTSDDPLEQALIDNGYTLAEAECGAANLRGALSDAEIQAVIEADTIEDISFATADEFAEALSPCLEDGADADDEGRDGRPGDEGPEGSGRGDDGPDPPGEVTPSRFLAALRASGVPEQEAQCVVEEVFARLDQDDVDALFHAGDAADVPEDVMDAFLAIADACGA